MYTYRALPSEAYEISPEEMVFFGEIMAYFAEERMIRPEMYESPESFAMITTTCAFEEELIHPEAYERFTAFGRAHFRHMMIRM